MFSFTYFNNKDRRILYLLNCDGFQLNDKTLTIYQNGKEFPLDFLSEEETLKVLNYVSDVLAELKIGVLSVEPTKIIPLFNINMILNDEKSAEKSKQYFIESVKKMEEYRKNPESALNDLLFGMKKKE